LISNPRTITMSTNATSSKPGPTAPVSSEYFGQPVLAVAITTIFLSTMFVGMRFWSRTIILRVTGLEDWLLLFGWVCPRHDIFGFAFFLLTVKNNSSSSARSPLRFAKPFVRFHFVETGPYHPRTGRLILYAITECNYGLGRYFQSLRPDEVIGYFKVSGYLRPHLFGIQHHLDDDKLTT